MLPDFIAPEQTILAYVGSLNFGVAWAPPLRDRDVADPLEMCFDSPYHTCHIRSLYVKPVLHNYGDLPYNFDPSLPTFQSHLRSLEPTWIGRPSMSSVFHCNTGLSCTVFKIKGNIKKKFPPCTFNWPIDWIILVNFETSVGLKN